MGEQFIAAGGWIVAADGKRVDFIRSAFDVRRFMYSQYVPRQRQPSAAQPKPEGDGK
jgi:hypothetical protein